MLRHVCVAYDDEQPAQWALQLASLIARESAARLTIAHVAPAVDEPLDDAEALADELLGLREDVRQRQRLTALAALHAPRVETRVRVLAGCVGAELVRLLHQERPDLVVAGARPTPRFARALVPRLRDTLLAAAPCPVVLVRSSPHLGPRPVVATSPTARGRDERAYALAEVLALELGGEPVGAGTPDGQERGRGGCRPKQRAALLVARGERCFGWRRRLGASRIEALLDVAACPVVVVPACAPDARRARGPVVTPERRRPARPMASSMSLASRRRPATSVNPAVRRASLHWQLFLADALVLIAATAVLVLAPVRVSTEVVLTEVLVLSAGVAVMLALHLVLLRRTLAPLRLLTDVMGTIDLRQLGRRVPTQEVRAAELAALADAFNAMLDRLEDERRQSVRRALAAQEDERLRIARELHDQVGQTLTALTIQAERAAQPPGPPDPQVLEHIAHTALQSLDDVRRIGRELRPEALDDLGLVNALIALCRRLAAQSATRVTHQLRLGAAVQISPDVELVIYRVAQEAITNALRHAAATRIDVTLHGFAGGAQLIVSDDGRGLPPDLPDDTAGLTGMRERALLVSGELTLHARPHGGTEVRLTIPAHAAGA